MLTSGKEGRSRGTACVGETTCEELASDESSSSSSMRKGSGVSGSIGLVTMESEREVSCS